MKSINIPEVRLGIVAVSRDCFPIALSTRRRQDIVTACKTKGFEPYECSVTVENETDMLKAVEEVKAAGCNALTVFLGNFGPETPETLIAKYFDGPVMYVAAAEGDGDMINGRGDAYCGMLNCSYNLGMRHLKAYIPEYPVGTAEELADKIAEFLPIVRAVLGVKNLKIITFGPRPQDFFACNAPIKGLYELGVEVEENSELDLLVAYKEHADDPRIPEVCTDMAAEMGEGKYYPDLLARMAQFELTLLDWAEAHKGSKKYVAFADKCWPAFPSQFGFEPCYVNSRLVSRGIPVSCEVDIYGALSEYIGMCVSGDTVTLLDINNSVPKYIYDEDIAGKFDYKLTDTFMGFHCGNTPSCKMCADRAVKYQLIQHRLRDFLVLFDLQEALLCAGLYHAVLILECVQHGFQLDWALCHEAGAGDAVPGVPQYAHDLIVTIAAAAYEEPRCLEDGVGADLCADLHRIHIIQAVNAVADPVHIGVAVAGEQIVPHEGAFPLESVQQIAGFLVQEPQAVIVCDLLGLPILIPVKPDGQGGHRAGNKADAAAYGRDIQNGPHRHRAAAQRRTEGRVQLGTVQRLLL